MTHISKLNKLQNTEMDSQFQIVSLSLKHNILSFNKEFSSWVQLEYHNISLKRGMGLVCGILGLGGMVQHGGLEHDVHKLGHGLEHELEHGLQHRIFPWHKDCGHLVVQHGAGWRLWNDKIHGAYGQHGLQMERYHA